MEEEFGVDFCLTYECLRSNFSEFRAALGKGWRFGLPRSAGQIEAILLHELAHIRRHDYLVNLMQIVVESLVFYHPAVWWISGVLRAERENCCDDVVVATQGDALAYAAALTALEHNRGAARYAVLAATGGSLVKRVRRLLIQPEGPRAALTPVLSAAILTVTAAAVMAAWQTSAPPRPPAPVAPPAPAPVVAVTPYTKWVSEDVAYIIRDDERTAFKNLRSDAEREHFIEQFWLRRDPTPGTPANEFKEEHYRRIAYANEHYAYAIPGWKTDRGRVYITYGPPDEKKGFSRIDGPNVRVDEQWLYRHIEGVGANVMIEFVDADGTGEYRMTLDPSAKGALAIQLPPGETSRTNSATPKAGATVQVMGPGAILISVPLNAYGDHKVTVYGRVDGKQGFQVFEQVVQGPAPLYTKIVKVPAGSHRLEVSVKDMTTGKLAADTIDFEVK